MCTIQVRLPNFTWMHEGEGARYILSNRICAVQQLKATNRDTSCRSRELLVTQDRQVMIPNFNNNGFLAEFACLLQLFLFWTVQ